MNIYKILSVLLCYPEKDITESTPWIREQLTSQGWNTDAMEKLISWLESEDLITLQETYVQTFDRNPGHSLHLFEHIYGEDRARGQAMVDLLEEYREHGFDLVTEELPDYLPLFLEFLSVCDSDKAATLLGDSIHVVNHLGQKVKESESPYSAVFEILLQLSPVEPQKMTTPPIRDMDEALEKFGPGVDGAEPLLQGAGCSLTSFSQSGVAENNTCTQCPDKAERRA